MRTVILLAVAAAAVAAPAVPPSAQRKSPADLAQRLSGTWTPNLDLTPAIGGGRGRGLPTPRRPLFQRGGGTSFPPGVRANPTNTEPTSSKADDLTPAERAERTAIRQLEQIEQTLTISATADRLTIADPRGERSCDVTGKSDKVRTFGFYMDVTCKWDKARLRQEFSATRSKVIDVWSVDGNGRLVLTAKIEGVDQNSPEATLVYDRS